MSHVAILIAIFTAAQSPTHKNCASARDALTSQIAEDIMYGHKGEPTTADSDLDLVKKFVKTICKDGIRR